jgi:20S proteasome alpha/beta subunit
MEGLMTIVAGLLCRDGIVIASDGQESDGEMKHLGIRKIYDTKAFGFTDAEILAVGMGSLAYISRAVEMIKDKSFTPHIKKPRDVADLAEDAVGEMQSRYGRHLNVALLLGVWCKYIPTTHKHGAHPAFGLYNVFPPEEDELVGVAESITDYSALGSGGSFARYLLDRLHNGSHPTTELTMEAAVREAVYVIEEVKKVDLYCSGETYVACIRQGDGIEHKNQREIKALIADLEKEDFTIKKKQREIMIRKNGTSH